MRLDQRASDSIFGEGCAFVEPRQFIKTQGRFYNFYSEMKLSWEGLRVMLASMGGIGGSFSGHFGGLDGS